MKLAPGATATLLALAAGSALTAQALRTAPPTPPAAPAPPSAQASALPNTQALFDGYVRDDKMPGIVAA